MLRLKFVDLFTKNNFVFQRFFRISYSSTEKWNFYIDPVGPISIVKRFTKNLVCASIG